jgi:hypothetical protein
LRLEREILLHVLNCGRRSENQRLSFNEFVDSWTGHRGLSPSRRGTIPPIFNKKIFY